MISEKLEQLQHETEQEMMEVPNNSKLGEMFQNSDLRADNSIQAEFLPDLTKTQLSDTNKTPEKVISTHGCINRPGCCPPDEPTCCCP